MTRRIRPIGFLFLTALFASPAIAQQDIGKGRFHVQAEFLEAYEQKSWKRGQEKTMLRTFRASIYLPVSKRSQGLRTKPNGFFIDEGYPSSGF
jgi:hypothetical protein